jgi:hypothetical protein
MIKILIHKNHNIYYMIILNYLPFKSKFRKFKINNFLNFQIQSAIMESLMSLKVELDDRIIDDSLYLFFYLLIVIKISQQRLSKFIK